MPDEPPQPAASISHRTISHSAISQTSTHQAPPWQARWTPSAAEGLLATRRDGNGTWR